MGNSRAVRDRFNPGYGSSEEIAVDRPESLLSRLADMYLIPELDGIAIWRLWIASDGISDSPNNAATTLPSLFVFHTPSGVFGLGSRYRVCLFVDTRGDPGHATRV